MDSNAENGKNRENVFYVHSMVLVEDPRLRGDDVLCLRGDDVPRLRGDDVPRLRGDDVPRLRGDDVL